VDAAAYPPLDHLVSVLREEMIWLQVRIRREGAGFELRHLDDSATQAVALRTVSSGELRQLALSTAAGEFRPLKSAPNLVRGWRFTTPSPRGLADALHHLYPATLPDWWAATAGGARPADFTEVAARQLGRSKILREFEGPSLANAVAIACGPAACGKHRRWNGPGLAPEPSGTKSLVPCLEPCPLFIGFARTCAESERGLSLPRESDE
jgi:hypothetical protein